MTALEPTLFVLESILQVEAARKKKITPYLLASSGYKLLLRPTYTSVILTIDESDMLQSKRAVVTRSAKYKVLAVYIPNFPKV